MCRGSKAIRKSSKWELRDALVIDNTCQCTLAPPNAKVSRHCEHSKDGKNFLVRQLFTFRGNPGNAKNVTAAKRRQETCGRGPGCEFGSKEKLGEASSTAAGRRAHGRGWRAASRKFCGRRQKSCKEIFPRSPATTTAPQPAQPRWIPPFLVRALGEAKEALVPTQTESGLGRSSLGASAGTRGELRTCEGSGRQHR